MVGRRSLRELVPPYSRIMPGRNELRADAIRIVEQLAELQPVVALNPCVQCNNWLKFGKLFDYADSVGAEFVATGHYARVGWDQLAERAPAHHSKGGGPSAAR